MFIIISIYKIRKKKKKAPLEYIFFQGTCLFYFDVSLLVDAGADVAAAADDDDKLCPARIGDKFFKSIDLSSANGEIVSTAEIISRVGGSCKKKRHLIYL